MAPSTSTDMNLLDLFKISHIDKRQFGYSLALIASIKILSARTHGKTLKLLLDKWIDGEKISEDIESIALKHFPSVDISYSRLDLGKSFRKRILDYVNEMSHNPLTLFSEL